MCQIGVQSFLKRKKNRTSSGHVQAGSQGASSQAQVVGRPMGWVAETCLERPRTPKLRPPLRARSSLSLSGRSLPPPPTTCLQSVLATAPRRTPKQCGARGEWSLLL